jgi:tetratricopeptide (TPR) repeat protein
LVLALAIPGRADTSAADLLKAGKADEALRVLNATLAQDPKDAVSYNLLCRVYFQLELWDNAMHMAEKSVALEPQNSFYHLWLGRAQGRKAENSNPFVAFGLARKVKTEFERAVALDANNLTARADLSEYYLEAPGFLGGDKNKARQQAEYIAQYDPALAGYISGRVEEKQGSGHAEEKFKKAIAAGENPSRYWMELAYFYRRNGKLNDMESAIGQALVSEHQNYVPDFDGAFLLLRAGRNFPGAIQMFRQYLSQDVPAEEGPVFQAHYLLGVLLEKRGERKDAAIEYKAALAMASQFRPARDALARVSR